MAIAFGKVSYLIRKRISNKYLSSTIITVLFAVLIFGPIFYFLITAGKFIGNTNINDIKIILTKAQGLIDMLPSFIASKLHQYVNPDNITQIYNTIAPIVGTLTKKTAVFFKDAFLIIIFFFFATLYGKEILAFLRKVIPIEDAKLESMFFGTSEVMSVVFYSTVMTAILEGILFGIIAKIYGFNFFFFTIMYAFSSMIPVVGGVIMWGPLSLYLYSTGNTTAALVVALYSIIVISIIADTFIKPLIIKYVKDTFEADTELNSLLIFFSIVAGLSSFGLWGIIIGPAVTAMFVSILKFYEKI
jgi:predicted PurR-regulated permease PerM